MNILVTGASGLVGSAAAQHLSRIPGVSVTALARRMIADKYQSVCCDLSCDDMEHALGARSFDAIVHCAAVIPAANMAEEFIFQQNTAMDRKIAQYASAHMCRLIYVSTVALYQNLTGEQVNSETSPIHTDTLYQKSKFDGEAFVRETCPSYAILRLPSPYGSGQNRTTVLKLFIQKALQSGSVGYFGQGSRTQNFVHVTDIARAVEKAILSKENDVFNIAAAQSVSMKELAALVVSIANQRFGCSASVEPVPKPDPQEEYRSNISIAKAERLLGWRPQVRLTDGIADWMSMLTDAAPQES